MKSNPVKSRGPKTKIAVRRFLFYPHVGAMSPMCAIIKSMKKHFSMVEKWGFVALLVIGAGFFVTQLTQVGLRPSVSFGQNAEGARPVTTTTAWLLPSRDGIRTAWTPSVAGETRHYAMVDDDTPRCDNVGTYNYTMSTSTVDIYGFRLDNIPDGSLISRIDFQLCTGLHSARRGVTSGLSVEPLINGANAGASGNVTLGNSMIPVTRPVIPMRYPINILKTANTTLDVAVALKPGNARGGRVSKVEAKIYYLPPAP